MIEVCNEAGEFSISRRETTTGALEMDISEACRLATGRRCECRKCYYCDRKLLYGKMRSGHEEKQHRARANGQLIESGSPRPHERMSAFGAIITSHARRIQAHRAGPSADGGTAPLATSSTRTKL